RRLGFERRRIRLCRKRRVPETRSATRQLRFPLFFFLLIVSFIPLGAPIFPCHEQLQQKQTAKPDSNSLPNKVAPLSTGTRILPPSVPCKVNLEDERLKELPKITVKFFLHASGNIAAKFPYDQAVVGSVRKIPKATWYAKERLWMFPIPSLSFAEKVLHETSGVNVELFQVENLDPVVHRAIAAASVVPDLRDDSRHDRAREDGRVLPDVSRKGSEACGSILRRCAFPPRVD
ncbi:uncharacterized protein LOC126609081, partial [Malus sylvestris]|uniref:uncharacterized protein LOC126609081 n=1 Tax=Malus sylvestris TaxID=3752 RepID=UPI0021AC8344